MADFVERSKVAIHDWSDLYGVGYAPEYFGGTSRFQITRTAITKMAGSELLGECTFTVKFLSNNTEDPPAQRNSGYNYAIDYEIWIDGVRRGTTRLVSRTQYINKNTTYTRTIRATNIPLNTSTTRPAYIRTVNDRPSSQALLFDSRNQGGDSLSGFPLGIQRSNFSSFSGFTLKNIATTFNATVTRVSSGTTHHASLWHGGTRIKLWTDLDNFTSLSLTLAESRTLLSRLSSVKSATVELRVGTVYGGTQLYIQSRTATVTVGELPTIGSVGISDSSGALTAVGNLVQGISNVTLSINSVSAGYGASVRTYGMEWAGVNHSGLTSATLHTGIITRTGNQTFTGRVSNSRGQVVTRSRTDNVLAWSPPTSSNISIVRANSGGSPSSSGSYVRVSGTHSVSALKVGTTNKNTLQVIIKYRERGVSAWTNLLNKTYPAGTITTSEAHTLGGGNVSTLKSYEVQVELIDRFSNYISTEIITSEQVPFSVGRTGVGIGKIWEKDALEVYGKSVLDGNLEVTGEIFNDIQTPSMRAFSSVQLADDYYDNFSSNLPARRAYTFSTSHSVGHPQLGGGVFYVTGYKTSNLYEYQMAYAYANNSFGLRMYARSKMNGEWIEWRQVHNVTTASGTGGSSGDSDVTTFTSSINGTLEQAMAEAFSAGAFPDGKSFQMMFHNAGSMYSFFGMADGNGRVYGFLLSGSNYRVVTRVSTGVWRIADITNTPY